MQINLTPDASLLVIAVIFIANYWVVRKFFFGPVSQVLAERETDIRGAEKVYEESLARFNEAAAEMEARLLLTKREGSVVREGFRTEALAHRTTVIDRTRSEAEQIVKTADTELASEVERARNTILTGADAIAKLAAETILGRSVA